MSPAAPPAPESSWWSELYDELLADVLLSRQDDGEVERTLSFLREVLELTPGARVFDQCCGIGSLALPLARAGYRVVGVDQAASYIERANRQADQAGLELELAAADAGGWIPETPCAGAFNWWTSFGYSPDDGDNARMLRCAFEALAPGGRFALDTMNLPGVLRDFQRDWITRRTTRRGAIVLLRESRLNLADGMMEKTWTYLLADGQRLEKHSSVRLYLPHTLVEMLRSVGFGEVELLGDLDRRPLSIDSPRCIAVARRPA